MPYKRLADRQEVQRRSGRIHAEQQAEEHAMVRKWLRRNDIPLPTNYRRLTDSDLDTMEGYIERARKALGYALPGQASQTTD